MLGHRGHDLRLQPGVEKEIISYIMICSFQRLLLPSCMEIKHILYSAGPSFSVKVYSMLHKYKRNLHFRANM